VRGDGLRSRRPTDAPLAETSSEALFLAALRPKVIKGWTGLAWPDDEVQTHGFEQTGQFPYTNLFASATLQGGQCGATHSQRVGQFALGAATALAGFFEEEADLGEVHGGGPE
jgi:hypothetical protein